MQLADRLFVPDERWGFEFREPEPIRANPYLDQEPVWQEPPLPEELVDLLQAQQEAEAKKFGAHEFLCTKDQKQIEAGKERGPRSGAALSLSEA